MAVNNFMMLRQQRLRDQPTSAIGMAGMAKRWPGQQGLPISQQPPMQTNTNATPPGNASPNFGPRPMPGQQTPTTPHTMMPPPLQVQTRQMPNPGTPWQSNGPQSANTLAGANGGRFYQDGTTWYSSTRPPAPTVTNQPNYGLQNENVQPNMAQTNPGIYAGPNVGNISVNANNEVTAAGPKQGGPVGPQGAPGGGGNGNTAPGRQSQKSTYGGGGTSTGTTSSGLAPAGSTNTNDQVGNPVNLAANAITSAGFNIESDGTITDKNQPPGTHGNINDPNSWDPAVRSALDYVNNGGSYKEGAVGTNYTPPPQQQGPVDSTPQTIEEWMAKYGLGQPPKFDQGAVDKMNAATNAQYMRQQGRSLQAQAEMQSRAGASADQMAGAMGDVTSAYGLQSAQEQARNNLQVQIQNFQQQADYYNKQFQIGMTLFSDAQSDQDRDYAYKYAQEMLRLGTEAQKQLISYQNDLQNQIGWKDILGMLLGAGTQIGSAAIGGYMGGGANAGLRGY